MGDSWEVRVMTVDEALELAAVLADPEASGDDDLWRCREPLDALRCEVLRLRRVTSELAAARAALLDCAKKCDVCELRPATRYGNGRICDDDACGHEVRCKRCWAVDDDHSGAWMCGLCGSEDVERIPRRGAWRYLPHAAAIRAAEAAR